MSGADLGTALGTCVVCSAPAVASCDAIVAFGPHHEDPSKPDPLASHTCAAALCDAHRTSVGVFALGPREVLSIDHCPFHRVRDWSKLPPIVSPTEAEAVRRAAIAELRRLGIREAARAKARA